MQRELFIVSPFRKGGGKFFNLRRVISTFGLSLCVAWASAQQTVITGTVFDSSGTPLPGVSVVSNQKNIKCVTDAEGKFSLKVSDAKVIKTLTFSFIGMSTQTVNYTGKEIKITLKESTNTVGEVVVTGIFERKKEGFTGSANRMSGDDIRKLSSGNILNAITMLDPGFRMGDNMISGSNPSSLPDFNMRGQSSMGDYSTDETIIMRGDIETRPNQPLFVLDGIIDM